MYIIAVYYYTLIMKNNKKEIEAVFSTLANRHFEKPSKCKNMEQIRYYVHELSSKISDYKKEFNYVPNSAYMLLSEYNATQNIMLFGDFKSTYGGLLN